MTYLFHFVSSGCLYKMSLKCMITKMRMDKTNVGVVMVVGCEGFYQNKSFLSLWPHELDLWRTPSQLFGHSDGPSTWVTKQPPNATRWRYSWQTHLQWDQRENQNQQKESNKFDALKIFKVFSLILGKDS